MQPFACEGAPRDLGLDQGRACGALLRARFREAGAAERAFVRLGLGDGEWLARDLARHFPHQAESLEGLARGARVPRRWLVRRLAESFAPGAERAAALVAGGRLARSIANDPAAEDRVVRRAEPEGGLRTLELTRPWLTAPLAGLNEEGLAGAVVTGAEPPVRDACAAPAALLLRDSLQRFDHVEAALEWCASRPGGGRATLLFADAHGDAAAVACDGAGRALRRPADGLLHAGIDADAAKRARDALAEGPAPLAAALASDAVVLDPVGRRLALVSAAGRAPLAWLTV